MGVDKVKNPKMIDSRLILFNGMSQRDVNDSGTPQIFILLFVNYHGFLGKLAAAQI